MYTNHLIGSIPNSFNNLSYLIELQIGINFLTGIIPKYLFNNLTNLEVFIIRQNYLIGKIPENIGNSNKLKYFYIFQNYFTGTLPLSLSLCTNLQYFGIYENYFTGTIPNYFGNNLQSLIYFYIDQNLFTGTIPLTLGNCINLTRFIIYDNLLTSTLPITLSNLMNIEYFYVNRNYLNGTIPETFLNFYKIQYFIFEYNFFSSTLPSFIGNLITLQDLSLHVNMFTGSIPSSYSNLTNLYYLSIYSNYLTSSIPNIFGNNLLLLQYLYLQDNLLTSYIPSSLSSCHELLYLELSNNLFTSISSSSLSSSLFQNLTKLISINLQNNNIYSRLPENFDNLAMLIYMKFNDNKFYGAIPISYSKLKSLQVLLLQNNYLTGSITYIFNETNQFNLYTIELSNNQLTGEIPITLFQLPSITTIVAVKNCFSSGINDNICKYSKYLTTLALDGIETASNCRNLLLSSLSSSSLLSSKTKSSYQTYHNFDNTIPYCLFNLTNLHTLHLSGIGFTGKLPNYISNNLVDLVLSYNYLTGIIPDIIQNRSWYNLDLSNNKLNGILSSNFGKNANNYALSLSSPLLSQIEVEILPPAINNVFDDDIKDVIIDISNNFNTFISNFTIPLIYFNVTTISKYSIKLNRISGNIPSSLIHAKNISILNGNLLNCNLDRKDLPRHDNDKNNYQCGSNSFNLPFYIWISISCSLLFIIIILIYLFIYKNNFLQEKYLFLLQMMQKYFNVINENQTKISKINNITSFFNLSLLVSKLSFFCTIMCIIFLLPIYTILSYYYSTHTYEYAWIVSAAFISGLIATIILLISLLMFTLIIMIATYKLFGYCNNTFNDCCSDIDDCNNHTENRNNSNYNNSTRLSQLSSPNSTPSSSVQTNISSILSIKPTYYQSFQICFLAFLFNFTIVAGVNIAYVIAVEYANSAVIIVIQILMSIFKISWNYYFFPFATRFIVIRILVRNCNNDDDGTYVSGYNKNNNDDNAISDKSGDKKMNSYDFNDDDNVEMDTYKINVYKYQHNDQSDKNNNNIVNITSSKNIIGIASDKTNDDNNNNYNDNNSTKRIKSKIIRKLPKYVSLEFFITLLNNIVIPCFIIAIISANCFKNIIIEPTAIVSNYFYIECTSFNFLNNGITLCEKYSPIYGTTSYQPPFSYSYNCSASFLQYYSPAYMYLCIIIAFINPLMYIFLYFLYKNISSKSRLHFFLKFLVPPTLKYNRSTSTTTTTVTTTTTTTTSGTSNISHSDNDIIVGDDNGVVLNNNCDHTSNSNNDQNNDHHDSYINNNRDNNHKIKNDNYNSNSLNNNDNDGADNNYVSDDNVYFDSHLMLVRQLSLLGLLMSFGVIFPPLSIAFSVAIISIYYQHKFQIGRFIILTSKTTPSITIPVTTTATSPPPPTTTTSIITATTLEFKDIQQLQQHHHHDVDNNNDDKQLHHLQQLNNDFYNKDILAFLYNSLWMILSVSFCFYTLFLFDAIGDQYGFYQSYWVLIVTPLIPLLLYILLIIINKFINMKKLLKDINERDINDITTYHDNNDVVNKNNNDSKIMKNDENNSSWRKHRSISSTNPSIFKNFSNNRNDSTQSSHIDNIYNVSVIEGDDIEVSYDDDDENMMRLSSEMSISDEKNNSRKSSIQRNTEDSIVDQRDSIEVFNILHSSDA